MLYSKLMGQSCMLYSKLIFHTHFIVCQTQFEANYQSTHVRQFVCSLVSQLVHLSRLYLQNSNPDFPEILHDVRNPKTKALHRARYKIFFLVSLFSSFCQTVIVSQRSRGELSIHTCPFVSLFVSSFVSSFVRHGISQEHQIRFF